MNGDLDTAARTIWAVSKRIPSLLMSGTPAADVKTSSGLFFDALITSK
ncbi:MULTISPECIES: hypothetical protein [unclassified Hyphomicrobium]|nr:MULTISPECIES: hypothetical protein [unclassified Hyphomicrobium]